MIIRFKTAELEDLCSDPKVQARKLGDVGARKLRTRLAEVLAASRVGELFNGKPHPLQGDLAGSFAVALDGGRRLVFEPADDPKPMTTDGVLDWPAVRSVCITFIGDYHA